ncbi:hypothetical protein JR316_0011415 [Psilocybe cubensis]|uniref:Uncharacterized protein n=2 Tax=Psilocybe cubensis TaxID=181762 RepID=A0A8H7XSM2_PSICU|nr:hypothetical protein JR316_0011415 [Psilocybe cubensis]KAH9475855.1 hypothetical protein JR316_0011415 [Psilocybe cubensis]
MQSLDLVDFPEELIEGILSHCVIAAITQPSRPSWHQSGPSSTPSQAIRGRLAPLLVCRKFLRIATPLYYHTVHVLSSAQLHRLLLDALLPSPALALHIRRIVFAGIWAEGGEILRMCEGSIKFLDITLDSTQLSGASGPIRDLDAEEFCEGLKELTALTHIVIRKPNDVYITRPKPRYVLSEIAKAMNSWEHLEYANIAFRASDDSGTLLHGSVEAQSSRGAHIQHGPITALTQSLSTRPNLQTFCTLLPSVWNEVILRVSANPSLERIILGDGHSQNIRSSPFTNSRSSTPTWSSKDHYAGPVSVGLPPSWPHFEMATSGVMGTGLFMLQAKKHPRLTELIRAGTSITRPRAQTLDHSSPPLPIIKPHVQGPSTPTQAPVSIRRASYSSPTNAVISNRVPPIYPPALKVPVQISAIIHRDMAYTHNPMRPQLYYRIPVRHQLAQAAAKPLWLVQIKVPIRPSIE